MRSRPRSGRARRHSFCCRPSGAVRVKPGLQSLLPKAEFRAAQDDVANVPKRDLRALAMTAVEYSLRGQRHGNSGARPHRTPISCRPRQKDEAPRFNRAARLLGCSAARRRGGVAVGGARAEAGAGHWNLGSESPELFASRLRAFRQGLSAAGYDEGRNVTIEYRWAEGHND